MSAKDVESSPRGYEIVAARSVSDERLRAFAASALPESNPERMLQSWWRRADPSCAVAAMHQATGVMAGLCAGRPSEWQIGGRRHPAIAICGWYVDPRHGGKLLGRRLVRQFETPSRMMYAYSMSEDAIQYLSRLGWVGPYTSTLLALPLPQIARIAQKILRPVDRFALEEYVVDTGALPGALGSKLDAIEASLPQDAPAQMCRGQKEWSWRLALSVPRSYRFCLASSAGEPIGYVAVRLTTQGGSRLLGKRQAAILTDLVTVDDDRALLRALVGKAVSFAGELGANVLLAATTIPRHRRSYAALGFLSSGLPVLGRPLRRRAPQFMWLPRGPGAALAADNIALSLSDSDVDLNL
jgi:hypothetical protein